MSRIGELVPTADGRKLLVRPCLHGEGVQLGIIGKRGGLVEAVPIGLDQIGALILVIDGISEMAWDEHRKQVLRAVSPLASKL